MPETSRTSPTPRSLLRRHLDYTSNLRHYRSVADTWLRHQHEGLVKELLVGLSPRDRRRLRKVFDRAAMDAQAGIIRAYADIEAAGDRLALLTPVRAMLRDSDMDATPADARHNRRDTKKNLQARRYSRETPQLGQHGD